MSHVIDGSEVFDLFPAPDWKARDADGTIYDVDTRLLKEGMPVADAARVILVGTRRAGPQGVILIPTEVSLVSRAAC